MNHLLVRRLKQRERASRSCRAVAAGEGGFTLLELLVVITIIIILISMLFPAFRGIQDQAKRTQAKNDLHQIATAISAFYTEYGRYPLPITVTTDIAATYSTTNNIVFDILRNDTKRDPTTVNALNPRQIVFIEPPIAKDQTTPKLGLKDGVWYDPWGYAYNVTIDANYNAVAKAPAYTDLTPTYTTADTDTGPKTGAIAWTYGPDAVIGTKQLSGGGDGKYKDPATGVQSDDVISWQ